MKTSIATVSISGTLETKLAAVAAAGFDGVEIFENDLLAYPGSPREVGAMIRDLGMACTLFQPFRDFEGMPEAVRGRVFDRAERKFDVMQELGTDLVLVCSNVSPQALGDRARIVADFHELGERAERRGLRIGYEALAWGRHVHDHRDAWAIVEQADHRAVGLILDSFHSLVRQIPSDSIAAIDPAKLFLVQIADAPWLDMEYLYWSRHFRNMPGQGDLALADYAAALAGIGYDGYYSLEIFNDRFRAASATTVALDGYRSLQLMAERQIVAMPPRVAVRGVEFLEFAAGEEEAEQLGAMLTALGFRPVGRHRRKAVTRWRQGGINLVVNSESEGFAHSFDLLHGASVCAIGLRVGDVAGAMARAKALKIDRFEQAVAPDEMQIPSVRAVGGSLLYFVADGAQEAMWAVEFEPLDGASEHVGAGLLAIDHIAQSMQYEEFLSWLLYYVALFDVTKTPQLEIADPLGLVQSQAVQTPDRSLRITLNGSMSQQTLSARFLHGYTGAGTQHIAFATADIFATARAMQAAGLERLPIPANYYDDLEARFDLAPELLAKLAAFNILYDRDDDGEYFQLYSRAFAKRVFFEVVERRGYDAFGATNATIRLAAQSRYKEETAS
ncbi:bifunctional sugar phosphate isomerase/epimerase/4-hydroxyphenylpyruvate dioxygenase family protein [Sphingomonas sp. PB4P5]|uniref:bifunctional sugar phosphate isomerase/epimerase/4-hydroxyphenylpyruvate dioxygenase family protein n=1 Tax=Parasphingomonas puruogangriensis TaxID=3096155 RepID=UPI002FC648C0